MAQGPIIVNFIDLEKEINLSYIYIGVLYYITYVRTYIHTYIHKYMAQSVEALRYNRKVAGSISEGATGKFHWYNPSGRTMALGSTQPLTEMSTENISWGVNAAGA